MKKTRWLSAFLGLSVAIVMASFSAAGAARAQAGNPNQIVIRSQDTDNNQIVVDSVTAAESGWLVIYKAADGRLGGVLGYAPVRQGVNTNFTADIDSRKVANTSTLFARLHVDKGILGKFEFPGPDAPAGDGNVMVAFGTTAAQPAPVAAPAQPAKPTGVQTGGANQMAIRSQDTNNNQIVVDSVTAAESGWLVIYKADEGRLGGVLGYTPVRQGVNTNFTVDVDSRKLTKMPTLFARLHMDKGILGKFEFPGPDAPAGDGNVMVAFGTTAATQ